MKTQLKKSISLFLAVLMVLSCWVWVAPEKASADHTTGQYYVKYVVDITAYSKQTKDSKLVITYKKNNGTGSEGTVTYDTPEANFQTNNINVVLYEGYIDGFPTNAALSMSLSWKAGGSTCSVGNARLMVGKDVASCTNVVNTVDSWTWSVGSWDFGGGSNTTFDRAANASTYPYINSADAMTATTLSCPEIGTSTTNTTTATIPTYWDQYGVKWIASTDTSYHLSTTENGSDDMAAAQDKGFWTAKDGSKGYVNINAAMQENYIADDNDEKDYYMVATVTNSKNDEVKASQKITVKYPLITLKLTAQ